MLTTTGFLRTRRRLSVGSLGIAMLGLAACGSGGTVTVENNGPAAVTVTFGENDWGDIPFRGGAVVNTDDCLEGPIVVTFESGRVVELAETACPGQRLVVRDESAELLAQREG